MKTRVFSDEELVAFLDGEHDFAPVAEIELALKEDALLAKRLEALRIDKRTLVHSFENLTATDQVPPSLLATNAFTPRWTQFAAVALLALGIGVGLGAMTPKSGEADWKDYVAAYQALYTNSTLNHVAQSDAAKRVELKRVSDAIGKNLSLDPLRVSKDVTYKRAQVLGHKGTALAQLAFLTSTGEPMALCIIRRNGRDSTKPTIDTMEGLSAASWSKGGYEYLLIGGRDQELISRLANQFSTSSL